MFDRAVALSKTVLVRGMQQSFLLMHAHYPRVDLPAMAQGLLEGYSVEELDSFEEEARVPTELFARSLVPDANEEDSPGFGTGDE